MPDDASRATRPALDIDALLPEIVLIQDLSLRDKVRAVWQALWAKSEFTDFHAVPTSGEIPYPNLPHMRCVIALALSIAESFERFHGKKVDRDVLIAACLLQDASKIVEYRPKHGGGIEKTPIGKAVPHAFEAARVALDHGIPLEVVHIIATHSPSATRFPSSLEGKIIYYADQLDVIAIHGDHWVKEQVISRG
jgi:hypothetical protein